MVFAFGQVESDRCDPYSECASGCGTCCHDGGSFVDLSSAGCDSDYIINGTFYPCQDESICDSNNGTVTDIDGNVYETLVIGDQLWISDN